MEKAIGIASDHGGKKLKHHISAYLKSMNYEIEDFGVSYDCVDSVDYPDYAMKLAREISEGKIERGILICGTGIGMSIAANKVSKIRATVVWDEFTAKMARLHNNSNILCLGERVLEFNRAIDLVKIWLSTEFEGGRHQQRLDRIASLEKKRI